MLNLPVHDAHDPLLRTPPTAAPVRPRQQPTGRRPDRPQGVRGLFAACADTFEGRRDTAVLMLLLTVPAERRWSGSRSPTSTWNLTSCRSLVRTAGEDAAVRP